MSLSSSFPKQRSEVERELGFGSQISGDKSKPLLLVLLEQFKYSSLGMNDAVRQNPFGQVPTQEGQSKKQAQLSAFDE